MNRLVFTTLAASLILGGTALAQAPGKPGEPPVSGVDLLRRAVVEAQSDADRNRKIREALPVLRADAIAGDEKAQYNLARLYETGVPNGNGTVATFPARAYAWYVAAARAGHPLAIKRIEATGSHPFGIEVPDTMTPDPKPQAPTIATAQKEATKQADVDLAALMEAAEAQAAATAPAAMGEPESKPAPEPETAPAKPIAIATPGDLLADAAPEAEPAITDETADEPQPAATGAAETAAEDGQAAETTAPANPDNTPDDSRSNIVAEPEAELTANADTNTEDAPPAIEEAEDPQAEEAETIAPDTDAETDRADTISEPVSFDPASNNGEAPITMGTSYQIRIGAFRDGANAAALVAKLEAEGIATLQDRKDDGEGGEWHLVQSAPMFDKAEAEALVETLKRDFAPDAELVELALANEDTQTDMQDATADATVDATVETPAADEGPDTAAEDPKEEPQDAPEVDAQGDADEEADSAVE